MRVLLDECLPKKLKYDLVSHQCPCAPEVGWAGVKNRELLTLAEASGFQVFLTIDQGIESQQNLTARRISVVLINSKSNRLSDLQCLVPEILRMVTSLKPGQLVKVDTGTNP